MNKGFARFVEFVEKVELIYTTISCDDKKNMFFENLK